MSKVFENDEWAVTMPDNHPTVALVARNEEIGVSISRMRDGSWQAELIPLIGAGGTAAEALHRLSEECAKYAAGMHLMSGWAGEDS
jgi:hypothetical protein